MQELQTLCGCFVAYLCTLLGVSGMEFRDGLHPFQPGLPSLLMSSFLSNIPPQVYGPQITGEMGVIHPGCFLLSWGGEGPWVSVTHLQSTRGAGKGC